VKHLYSLPVAVLDLNRNPQNDFAAVGQAAPMPGKRE